MSSQDSGSTWTTIANLESVLFSDVGMTSSGQVQAISSEVLSGIWVSTDYGVTWVQSYASSNSWAYVSTYGSGQEMVSAGPLGPIQISDDTGSTWTNYNTDAMYFYDLVLSSNGEMLVIATADGIYTANPMFTSSDSGGGKSSGSSALSAGATAGISVGVIAFVCIVAALVAFKLGYFAPRKAVEKDVPLGAAVSNPI